MSVPNIDFHRIARAAADVTIIAKAASRKLAAGATSSVRPQPSAPLRPGSGAGPVLRFSAARGEVVGQREITKAFTRSGGGGGQINQGTGYIAPVWTQTTHVRHTEFWLRDWRTGQEHHHSLEGYENVVLRDGQDVTLVWCNGVLIWIKNHTADQAHFLVDHEQFLPPLCRGEGFLVRLLAASPVAGVVWVVCWFGLAIVLEPVRMAPSDLRPSGLWLGLLTVLSLPAALVAGVVLYRWLTRRDERIARTTSECRARAEAEMGAAYRQYLA